MKNMLYIAALCCALLAGCSVKESTIPQPNRFPKLISQIRTEHASGDVSISNYLYDEQQRVKQVLVTRVSSDMTVTNSLCEFTYGNGRIEVETSKDRFTILLDEAGYARQTTAGGQTTGTYRYNANGYYYEPEADGGSWSDYQYLLAGDRCNLAMIKKHGMTKFSEVPGLLFRSTFEYGELPNNASLNLSYLITQDSHSNNAPPMLFDWGGKRDSNMPKVRNTQDYGSSPMQETSYLYTYEKDTEGNIIRITEKTDTDRTINVYTIAYK